MYFFLSSSQFFYLYVKPFQFGFMDFTGVFQGSEDGGVFLELAYGGLLEKITSWIV